MEEFISKKFSELIDENVNFTFTKFGDGEFYCMNFTNGHNCDGDSYTRWLGEELINSFKHLTYKDFVYLGKWHNPNAVDFFSKLSNQNKINWVHYHSVMNASPVNGIEFDSFSNDYLLRLVKSIRDSKRKKIIISNHKNKKLKDIFNANSYVEVLGSDWSESYSEYEKKVLNELTDDCIILTAAGMCSKVLISNLLKIKENITCIDIGSGFDLLATGIKSRPWPHSYQDELEYYKSIL